MEPALVVVGLSHRTAPVEVRERFWMSADQREEALAALSQAEAIEEIVVFSTCQRTEFVVWGDPTLAINSVLRFLTAQYNLKLCEWKSFYRLLDDAALAHAFRVSCGLDSISVEDSQIGRQVNAAWQQARQIGSTGRFLDAVLRKALAVRRRVRKETAIDSQFISAPEAAAEVALDIFDSLAQRNIVVLGHGSMGEGLAEALISRGAGSIFVLNRGNQRSEQKAGKEGIEVRPFEELNRRLAEADLVICATSAPLFLLTAGQIEKIAAQRAGRKLVLIDLGMPRNIDPGVRAISSVLLYDLDDLERTVKRPATAREVESETQRIILEEVHASRKEVMADEEARELAALRHRLDEICRQELESFYSEQGPFPKDQERLIAAVSVRITHKIAGSLARELRGQPENKGNKRIAVPL